MRSWIRKSLALGLLSLLAWCLMPAGPAAAAEGEETTTTPTEEPPPVVETPPPVETPAETTPPPAETPVTTTPSESTPPTPSATTPVEGTRSTGSTSSGSGSSSGSSGSTTSSGSTGTTTTPSRTATTHRSSHVRSNPTRSSGSSSGGGSKPSGGSSGGNGNTASGGNSSGGGTSHHSDSSSGGGGSRASTPQPSFSPQGIDEGASAVSHVASHVGEAFAEALPTAPLKKIGTQIGAHVGLIPAKSGIAQRHAVDRLSTALGAALIGSAVAVKRDPPASSNPIRFLEPPGGKSNLIYVLVIFGLLAIAALLIAREIRVGLGFGVKRERVSVAGSAIGEKLRAGQAWARARDFSERGSLRFRRFRANAVAGLRSLF